MNPPPQCNSCGKVMVEVGVSIPKEWSHNEKYMGSFFAHDFFIHKDWPRSFLGETLNSVPSRPTNVRNANRMLQAIDVLFGKADALYWWDSFESVDRNTFNQFTLSEIGIDLPKSKDIKLV